MFPSHLHVVGTIVVSASLCNTFSLRYYFKTKFEECFRTRELNSTSLFIDWLRGQFVAIENFSQSLEGETEFMMKRSYSEMSVTLTAIPENLIKQDCFKSTLSGSHKFRVKKIADISKPEAKQIEEIEEPEEEATAAELKLNKSNARMILLELEDVNNACVKAIETERIETLTDVKEGFIIGLQGPLELRCSRLMLEKRNIVSVEIGPKEEREPEPVREDKPNPATIVIPNFVDTGPQRLQDAKIETIPSVEVKDESRPPPSEIKKEDIQVISLLEDWDEDDEDDCIVLN